MRTVAGGQREPGPQARAVLGRRPDLGQRAGWQRRCRRPGQRCRLLVRCPCIEAYGGGGRIDRVPQRIETLAVGGDAQIRVMPCVPGQPGHRAGSDLDTEHRAPSLLVGRDHERGAVGRPPVFLSPAIPVRRDLARGGRSVERQDHQAHVDRLVRRAASLEQAGHLRAVRRDSRPVPVAAAVVGEHAPVAGRRVEGDERRPT